MYWFRDDQVIGMILLGLQFILLSLGGWITVTYAFRLRSNERVPVGIGLGIILFVFFANIYGRWIAPEWAFWTSIVSVFVVGGCSWILNRKQMLDYRDLRVWPQLLCIGIGIVIFILIGRGLAIFDDRKNLSLISIMAAGDIPPHFYMNSEFLFSYHYGFQLLGASMMRIGGLFPWSAFDISKGIIAGLAILLGFIWARRSGGGIAGGIVFSFLLLFMSGTRWLLLLLPASLVQRASQYLSMWGSGASTAPTVFQGLNSIWAIAGGPPTPIPFAFVNGILQPFILSLQAGPRSFALLIFFTMLLVVRRRRNFLSMGVVAMLMAAWALAAEAEFALFVLGVGFLCAILVLSRSRMFKLTDLRALFGMTFAAGLVSLVQGGTITEIGRGLLEQLHRGGEIGTLGPDVGFGFRIPPAIVSSHLGEMRILNVGELAVALFEIGPLLLLFPVALYLTWRYLRRGNQFMGAFGISAFFGFILPIFFTYSVDRDVTRMTQYAVVGWLIISWQAIVAAWKRGGVAYRYGLAGLGFVSVIGGLVVVGPLLTSLHTSVFADGIELLDAKMLQSNWDMLTTGADVLDSDPWRAVVVTGRLTRSSSSSNSILPAWEELLGMPDVDRVLSEGYEYVYVDNYFWNSMTEDERTSYSQPCVKLVDEELDKVGIDMRRLFDLTSCK